MVTFGDPDYNWLAINNDIELTEGSFTLFTFWHFENYFLVILKLIFPEEGMCK